MTVRDRRHGVDFRPPQRQAAAPAPARYDVDKLERLRAKMEGLTAAADHLREAERAARAAWMQAKRYREDLQQPGGMGSEASIRSAEQAEQKARITFDRALAASAEATEKRVALAQLVNNLDAFVGKHRGAAHITNTEARGA